MSAHCRKAYVSVNLDVDQEGVFHPRFIRWKNGLIFQIDQVLNTPPENRRSDRRSPTARPQKSYTPAVGQTPCV